MDVTGVSDRRGGFRSYLTPQAHRIFDQCASPDRFESHFFAVIHPLPHICEPPCRAVRIGRVELDLEDAGLW